MHHLDCLLVQAVSTCREALLQDRALSNSPQWGLPKLQPYSNALCAGGKEWQAAVDLLHSTRERSAVAASAAARASAAAEVAEAFETACAVDGGFHACSVNSTSERGLASQVLPLAYSLLCTKRPSVDDVLGLLGIALDTSCPSPLLVAMTSVVLVRPNQRFSSCSFPCQASPHYARDRNAHPR